MKTDVILEAKNLDDARLVELGLDGNREAFGELVTRYQSPVCALAYSACGNLGQSEDVAQETFVIAWRKLGDLKEAAKFKSWLFGIARNLLNNSFREKARNPLAAAEPLDESMTMSAAASNPAKQAITKEEEAILWRSLEEVPETYREPLILFYREHQSIERVAETLELTEEAARQRLSRGRKLLQERVAAFVEGALQQTGPGTTFTLAVLAALSATSIPTKAATFGAAAKGGVAVKAAGLASLLASIVTPLLAAWGMWLQYRATWKLARTDAERRVFRIFYISIWASVGVFVVLTCLLQSYGIALARINPWLFAGVQIGQIFVYVIFIICLGNWFFRAVKKLKAGQQSDDRFACVKTSGWEYRSRFELFGLPFVHIRFGGHGFGGKRWQPAVKAWIAISDAFAFGVLFAYAGVAVAPVSVGGFALGLLSYGGLTVGALVIGGFGFGIWAFAPLAVGWQAFGDTAVAWNIASGGQYGIAYHYALGTTAYAEQVNTPHVYAMVKANPFFRFCWFVLRPNVYWLIWAWVLPLTAFMVVGTRISRKRATNSQLKPSV